MRFFTDHLPHITHPSNQTNSLRQPPSIYHHHSRNPASSTPNQSAVTLPMPPERWSTFKKLSKNSSGANTLSPKLNNPSSLTIPTSLHIKNHSRHEHSQSSTRKSSYSSSIVDPHLSNSKAPGRITPIPGLRSSSALSNVSFRSLRSINSRIKVRIQSFGQALESRSQRKPELDWSSFRAEYELHLARGSIIERCLVEVDLGPTVTERGRAWIDAVWTLADRLSPPLPAALAQSSATGLLPLLDPLRQSLHNLAVELPYNHLDDTEDFDKFESLVIILRRSIWLAQLIEKVIEIVSQVGLVKFELINNNSNHINNNNKLSNSNNLIQSNDFIDQENHLDQYITCINLISQWSGDIKGRTGSGQHWRGSIKVS